MSNGITAEQHHPEKGVEARGNKCQHEDPPTSPGCGEIFTSKENRKERGQKRVGDAKGLDNDHHQRRRNGHADDRAHPSWIRSNFPLYKFTKPRPGELPASWM